MPGVNTVSYKGALDSFERFIQQDDGTQIWGSGAAVGDVILKRTGAGQVTLTGSLISGAQATAPTITPGTGYSAATIATGSTDTAGQFSYTSTAVGARTTATITFGGTHAAAPKSVVLWPGNANASASTAQLYTSFTATAITIASGATDTATAQTWNYAVFF